MMYPANHLSAAIATAAIPAGESIGAAQAWGLLIGLLILCCTLLWWLTEPGQDDASWAGAGSLRRAQRRNRPPEQRSRTTRLVVAPRATGRS
jgi:hypothetical protein